MSLTYQPFADVPELAQILSDADASSVPAKPTSTGSRVWTWALVAVGIGIGLWANSRR